MKKVYTFVGGKVVVQTEQTLQLLVKNEKSGNFLAMDEEGKLYSNNVQGMIEDLKKENPLIDAFAWVVAQYLLQRMTGGVREI